MTIGHLLFSLTTSLYILIAVKFLEEKDLRKVFGQQYEAYQQKCANAYHSQSKEKLCRSNNALVKSIFYYSAF